MESVAKKSKYNKFPAEVKVDAKNGVVTLRELEMDKDTGALGKAIGEIFEFDIADLKFKPQPGIWWVTLNAKSTVLYDQNVYKSDAPCKMRFAAFQSKDGELPTPRVDSGGPRTFYSKEQHKTITQTFDPSVQMDALIDVVSGPHKGAQIAWSLPYVFEAKPSTGMAMINGTKGQNEKVEVFFACLGISHIDLPYSDNLLPDIERAALKAAATFQGSIEKGRVVKPTPLAADDDEKPRRKAKK